MSPGNRRDDALAIHAAGVAGADPEPRVAAAIAGGPRPSRRAWILAVGKAGPAMAAGAADALRRFETPVAGGLVVGPVATRLPAPLQHVVGDHPVPGVRSAAAASHIALLCGRIARDDTVLVLVSGGASSLIAAPVDGLAPEDFAALQRLLADAGLPIGELNTVRKRFSRLAAGRLRLAIPARDVRVYCVSDVPGDDPRDIGSGPCEPDPATAADVRAILRASGLWGDLPGAVRRLIEPAETGAAAETPKPGHPAFAGAGTTIVASNRDARRAAARMALKLGYRVESAPDLVTGDAATAGRRLAEVLVAAAGDPVQARIWGGETTVRLTPAAGVGGRCQELVLAGAAVLERHPAIAALLLAAGTDGRDGPTDAAGAVVDGATLSAIRAAGIDPHDALERHDAYRALDAAGALVRTGPTGTNVMDLMVGLAGG